MAINFEDPAKGQWTKMGDFLDWIAANQPEVEAYLREKTREFTPVNIGDYLGVDNPGFLNPWIEEFKLQKVQHPAISFVEFQATKDIDEDADVNELSGVNIHIDVSITGILDGAIGSGNASISKLRQQEKGEWASFNALSPLMYWESEMRVGDRLLVTDYRGEQVKEKWEEIAPLTIGQIVYSWYDEITWGGTSPAKREEKYSVLTKYKQWATENQDKLIELQNPGGDGGKVLLTAQAFEWLSGEGKQDN